MKKLIYYLIFLLALVMMLLACYACHSQKSMTYSNATTDSVNLCMKDSSAQRFEFTFDSLELWAELRNFGTSEPRKMAALGCSFFESDKSMTELPTTVIPYHAVIYGGKLLSDKTSAIVHDSISTHSSTQAHKTTQIRASPSSLITNHSSLIIVVALAIVILLIWIYLIKIIQNKY